MEEHFLENFVKQLDPKAVLGSNKDDFRPCYNSHGDCIEFQASHEGYVADRIDEFLTIYRSCETREPIGFQIKDVQALISKYGADGLAFNAEVRGPVLISVNWLLLSAYGDGPNSIGRRDGYASALKSTQDIQDEVTIP